VTIAALQLSGAWSQAVASTPRAPATGQAVLSGINAWALAQLPPAQIEPQLALMQAAGVTVVRRDAPWDQIEPIGPLALVHAYQWASTDEWVRELAVDHLTWQPVIDYSAPWAAVKSGNFLHSPPTDPAEYAAFAQALAARYGDSGSFWQANPQLPYEPVRIFEIWNEENDQAFWDTGVDPALYAQLYAQSRANIKAVDPAGQVIVGGLTDSTAVTASQFVEGMFQSDPGLHGNVDGFALHPYAATDVAVEALLRAFRLTLDSLGESSTPIDITEFGWRTGSPAVEQWRARAMGNLSVSLSRSNCGVRVISPYDWINPPSVSGDGDFGLAGPQGLRPSGLAWFQGLRRAAGIPTSSLCSIVPAKTVGTPTASDASLTGLAVGKPRLRFALRAGANGPQIKSIVVSLPRGISLGHSRRQVARGLAVRGPGGDVFTVSRGSLVITLKRSVTAVSITIDHGALTESRGLVKLVKRVIKLNRAAKHRTKKALTLRVAVRITNTVGATNRFVLRFLVS
jgi:polysaccharide biosynthesis protein PslG